MKHTAYHIGDRSLSLILAQQMADGRPLVIVTQRDRLTQMTEDYGSATIITHRELVSKHEQIYRLLSKGGVVFIDGIEHYRHTSAQRTKKICRLARRPVDFVTTGVMDAQAFLTFMVLTRKFSSRSEGLMVLVPKHIYYERRPIQRTEMMREHIETLFRKALIERQGVMYDILQENTDMIMKRG